VLLQLRTECNRRFTLNSKQSFVLFVCCFGSLREWFYGHSTMLLAKLNCFNSNSTITRVWDRRVQIFLEVFNEKKCTSEGCLRTVLSFCPFMNSLRSMTNYLDKTWKRHESCPETKSGLNEDIDEKPQARILHPLSTEVDNSLNGFQSQCATHCKPKARRVVLKNFLFRLCL